MGLLDRFRRQAQDRPTTPQAPPPRRRHMFSVVDVETTGLDPQRDRIVEMAIVQTDGQDITSQWCTLVNPGTGDAGPTRIHGIASEWLAAAPSFDDLVGDISARLVGRVPVAHNALFDFAFIDSELARAGLRSGDYTAACSMELATTLGLPGSLRAACQHMGIPHQPHSAINDALATAQLFGMLLQYVDPISFDGKAAPPGCFPEVGPSGLVVNRAEAREVTAARDFLAAAMASLPAHETGTAPRTAATESYLALLGDALMDGYLSPEEQRQLLDLAGRLGLSEAEIRDVHHEFVLSLLDAALADRRVSRDERNQVETAAAWLGVDLSDWDAKVKAARARVKAAQKRFRDEMNGKAVVFTGRGVHPRNIQSALAAKHGMTVKSSVGKGVALVVAGAEGPETGATTKAREQDIPIIVESVFWERLGEL